MKVDVTQLYNLLPAIYRIRDAELKEPLKALLTVIAEQVAVLDENLAQAYDDHFIETCADWVVPYIGDLIGYRTINGIPAKVSSPRAQVANTIAYRRRKGTASMLEQLARDVTGWDAHVVEFFQLLATTQYLNHLRPRNFYAPDLRKWEPLERLGTAFETTAHTLDVRRIARQRGKYNIPNIGIFLWRLHAYSLTNSPAARLDNGRFFFSPLGNDTPLFNLPLTEDEITHLATPQNVPMPISRRVLGTYLDTYYGKGKSLFITVDGAEKQSSQIVVCNLSDDKGKWMHKPPKDKIAIDPVLGRIAFPSSAGKRRNVVVTFHYGFSADMSGGEYDRAATFIKELQVVRRVASPKKIQDDPNSIHGQGIVEIADNARYSEKIKIDAGESDKIELRAANRQRPHIALTAPMVITGGDQAEITLNGLLISGNTIQVTGKLKKLRFVLCTLNPGLSLVDEKLHQPVQPSLIVKSPNTIVEIDRCILGGIHADVSTRFVITNSIIDATAEVKVAFAGTVGKNAGGSLHIENSTLIGKVHTRQLELATNTIFLAKLDLGDNWDTAVWSDRRQEGCLRFSYVPPKSITPRQFRCQPELAEQAMEEKLRDQAKQTNPPPTQIELDAGIKAAQLSECLRVKPQFTSLRYGDPGYAQLSRHCAIEIREGADNESEMGVFNDLLQPQRETDLRVRLDEYLRVGLEAGVFYAS